MSYTCRNCGIQAENEQSLCSAVEAGTEENFCGIPEEWICEATLPTMKYICRNCGAVSVQTNNLCKPEEID